MVQIKCNECGRNHKKHTSVSLKFDASSKQYYYLPSNKELQLPVVHIGQTCYDKISNTIK